jgi:hypothetical protein
MLRQAQTGIFYISVCSEPSQGTVPGFQPCISSFRWVTFMCAALANRFLFFTFYHAIDRAMVNFLLIDFSKEEGLVPGRTGSLMKRFAYRMAWPERRRKLLVL